MKQLQRILVGLDFRGEGGGASITEGSLAAARQALWLAQRTDASVDFLHSTFLDAENEESAQVPENAKNLVDSLMAEHGQGVDSDGLTVVEERPWVALLRRAVSGQGDLVVVAKRNHTKRDDRKLGSVSVKLLRKCPTPVWAVKPEHPAEHRCVVAATDLTPVGDLATEYGSFIANAENCDLFVVHAWQKSMEMQLSGARGGLEEAARREKETVNAALKHIRGVPAVEALGDRGKIFIACDTPSRAILQVVSDQSPDLVVMGTVSRSGLAGVVVGNTAEKLLYKLDCSLLAVKPDDFVCPFPLG